MPPDRPIHFIYVLIPEQIGPEERWTGFADPLEIALTRAGIGAVTGGGALYDAPDDEDGSREIIHCGVDVDVYDLDAGRALLRDELAELGCPAGTRLSFANDPREDVFDGTAWRLDVAARHLQ